MTRSIIILVLAYLSIGAFALFMYFLTPGLVGLYNLSDVAAELSVKCVRMNLIQEVIIWAMAFTLPNFLRAAGDVRFTMAVSVFSMWIFRVFLSIVLGRFLKMGLVGVLIGMFADWYFRSICFIIRFIGGSWKTKAVI